jgi:RNA-directed DNA polymerase
MSETLNSRNSSTRLTRSLKQIRQWCRDNRHRPVGVQWRQLVSKMRGHCGYYGVRGNYAALDRFARSVKKAWHKWLSRRSNQAYIRWEAFERLLRRYPLPNPRTIQRPKQLPLSEPLG